MKVEITDIGTTKRQMKVTIPAQEDCVRHRGRYTAT